MLLSLRTLDLARLLPWLAQVCHGAARGRSVAAFPPNFNARPCTSAYFQSCFLRILFVLFRCYNLPFPFEPSWVNVQGVLEHSLLSYNQCKQGCIDPRAEFPC